MRAMQLTDFCRRRGDLYGTRSVFSYARKMAKTFKGIENVYTQHAPLLSETLRLVGNNDLSVQDYPFASETGVCLPCQISL